MNPHLGSSFRNTHVTFLTRPVPESNRLPRTARLGSKHDMNHTSRTAKAGAIIGE
jgi:hypothetical protein